MADHRCYRCAHKVNIGPRDVRNRVRCLPPAGVSEDPFWKAYASGRWRDLDEGEVRGSEDCRLFQEEKGK
jgi:hypothetical protein